MNMGNRINPIPHLERRGMGLLVLTLYTGCLILVGAAYAAGPAPQPKGSTKEQISYYLAAYETADPQDPLVMRTHGIFKRVLAAADKRAALYPHLRIFKSSGPTMAMALPDGFIVLTTKAMNVCFNGVDREKGDARMAFVLGHELGHMADGDFWHLKTAMSLAGEPGLEEIRQLITDSSDISKADKKNWAIHRQAKEVRADDCGFMYAGISGFRVDTLIHGDDDATDFFTHWTRQAPHQLVDLSHPSPENRTRFLKNRLKKLSDGIDFYKYGVRLAHFGHYEDALYFFREFQNIFPSREVFNNLGYCRLQQAIEQMPPSVAYHYWLPSALDLATRADKIRLKGVRGNEEPLSPEARALIEDAMRYFKIATEKDQTHWSAFLNLAVTHFYLKNFFDSRAAIEKAHALAPKNPLIATTRALILNLQDPMVDMWQEATHQLEIIVNQTPTDLCALYNLAVLHEDRGRDGKAAQLWEALTSHLSQLPAPIQTAVALKAGISQKGLAPPSQPAAIPWQLPLALGTDLLEDATAKKKLASWTHLDFNWGKGNLQGRIWTGPDGTQILEKDEFVDMVVLTCDNGKALAELDRHFGPPRSSRHGTGGLLLDYASGITALVTNGKPTEIWLEQTRD